MRLLATLALTCCIMAATAQPAPLQVQVFDLPPFVEVDLCAPISTLIKPNATGGYSLVVEADPSVLPAISQAVVNNALQLGISADINTTRPIKITVTLPADQLQAVSHQGPGAEVFIAPGFQVKSFTATAAFGAGRLSVTGMNAQNVTEVLSSTGDSFLSGTFGTVDITTTGTGSVYIKGVQDAVVLTMQGVSEAFVQPASDTAAISGTAQGLNTVQYTAGTCTVQSSFGPLLSICQRVPFLVTPAVDPVWTCGISTQGPFSCSAEGSALTSSGGVDSLTGPPGTFPTEAVGSATSAFTPSSYSVQGPTPAGGGVQQQAGSVTPGSTTATSGVVGTGSVSASSVAGPGGAQTSTTQGGLTTGFQTTGQQTTGGSTAARATSTAFSSSSSSSTATASAGSAGAQSVGGVVRLGPGGSTAAATSQACEAYPQELAMTSS